MNNRDLFTYISNLESEDYTTTPRYNLAPEELNLLEQGLIKKTKEQFSPESIVAVWINPHSKYANFIRCHESKFFPEVTEVSDDIEEGTTFLALVDLREGIDRVVHSATVSRFNCGTDLHDESRDQNLKDSRRTGFIFVDELIELNNFTSEEFYEFYTRRGIDLNKCVSVETNFRIGDKTRKYLGFNTAQLIYSTIFNDVYKKNPEVNQAAVFASINRASVISFNQVGLNYEALMGRSDLLTPESKIGLDYMPICIINDPQTITLFESMDIELPELTI